MQLDFHYYATYCAAYLAGYTHEECMDICYSAQFVDCCSATLLNKLKAPAIAATTQLQLELMDYGTDIISLQNITRIWSSFHFLPADLYAEKRKCSKLYRCKYRLICGPNGELLIRTVKQAKDASLQAIGIAMHVLADTWAHRYFAGTPSLVINNTDRFFYEIVSDDEGSTDHIITFKHHPSAPDDLDAHVYMNSIYQYSETSIMNLGHGRAGHLPDYSFARYRYLPAWGEYEEIIKDNPSDYMKAFTQMIYAMKFIRGEQDAFRKDTYATETVKPWLSRIKEIIEKRQLLASDDWKAFGEELSGKTITDYSMDTYFEEYTNSPVEERDHTFLGRFIHGALVHKGMVIDEIFRSGNMLAGFAKKMINKEGR